MSYGRRRGFKRQGCARRDDTAIRADPAQTQRLMKGLFEEINSISEHTDDAVVFFSTGKDSVVLLDLCKKHLKRIEAVFLYVVPDLEYKNAILEKYEKRYEIKIHQLPLWDVSGTFAEYSKAKVPKLRQADVENHARELFDIEYIAYGYKMADSTFRGGLLNAPYVERGIDKKNHRIFPLARWSEREVMHYIKLNKLFLSPEYHYDFRDINEFTPDSLRFIKQKFPRDFERIMSFYPFLAYKI